MKFWIGFAGGVIATISTAAVAVASFIGGAMFYSEITKPTKKSEYSK